VVAGFSDVVASRRWVVAGSEAVVRVAAGTIEAALRAGVSLVVDTFVVEILVDPFVSESASEGTESLHPAATSRHVASALATGRFTGSSLVDSTTRSDRSEPRSRPRSVRA
jgi:hypothetical protein